MSYSLRAHMLVLRVSSIHQNQTKAFRTSHVSKPNVLVCNAKQRIINACDAYERAGGTKLRSERSDAMIGVKTYHKTSNGYYANNQRYIIEYHVYTT